VKTRTLLVCGVVGGPLFVAVFLVEGATRAGYDSLRHPFSSLALGDSGWMQIANFVVAGARGTPVLLGKVEGLDGYQCIRLLPTPSGRR
jgi:hypothetical protein